MFKLGNTFGARTKLQAETSHADRNATLQGAQMAAGRAKKAYQVKADELTAARSQLAELDRIIGEQVADDLDANMDILERQTTHARIQQLESATAVLRQRKDEAEAAVQHAEQAAAVEAEANALAQNEAVALRIDEAFEALH